MERFFDVLFSGSALFVLSPLLVPIALILRLTGEGEIFFLQERIGRNGKTFQLFKFATMLKDSPNVGTGTVTVKDDPRVLPLGKVLRKTKINELPQLLNILIGDMSVIGPRPLTPETFRAYLPDTQDIVMTVRPGLSGIGSIVFRGEEDILQGATASVQFYESVIAPYKGSLECWFVENRGMKTYFLAIFATIFAVVFPNTGIAWRVFCNLPSPPTELKEPLKFLT